MKPLLAAALLALVGCSGPTPESSPEGQVPAGLANPASVHCGKVGGRLELRDEAGGAVGYCHLPDGRVVEEWTLFRAAQAEAA